VRPTRWWLVLGRVSIILVFASLVKPIVVQAETVPAKTAGIVVKERPSGLEIENNFLKVTLNKKKNYQISGLINKRGRGKNLIGSVESTFRLPGQGVKTTEEAKRRRLWWGDGDSYSNCRYRINKQADKVEIIVTQENKFFNYKRTLTIYDYSPSLKIKYELKARTSFEVQVGWFPSLKFPVYLNAYTYPALTAQGRIIKQANIFSPAGKPIKKNAKLTNALQWYASYNSQSREGIIVSFPHPQGYDYFRSRFSYPKLGIGKKNSALRIAHPAFGNWAFNRLIKKGNIIEAEFCLTVFQGDALRIGTQTYHGLGGNIEVPKTISLAGILSRTRDYTLWYQGAMKFVFRDEKLKKDTPGLKEIKISAARGEYEPFQLVISPEKDLRNMRLEFTDLTSPGNRISKDNITYNPIGYHPVNHYPDILLRRQTIDVPKGKNQPIWITVKVPLNARAGKYRGKIKVLGDNVPGEIVPLDLTVWDFALPREPSLRTNYAIWPGYVYKYEKVKKGSPAAKEVLKNYYKNLAEHRVASALMPWAYYPVVREVGGKVKVDFSKFDEFTGFALDKLGFNSLVFPYGRVTGQTQKIKFLGAEPVSERYERLWSEYLRITAQHLKEKGWFKKTYLYLSDEPYEEVFDVLREAGKIVRENIPEMPIMVAKDISMVAPALSDVVNVWCPPAVYYRSNLARPLQKKGDYVWVYNPMPGVGNGTAQDVPIFYWWVWKHKIDGVFQYAVNDWAGGPYNNLGLGNAFYPGGDGKPINSVRWELTREGLENYEYLHLLEKKIKEAKDNLNKRPALKKIIKEAEDTLTKVRKSVRYDRTQVDNDPDVYPRYRYPNPAPVNLYQLREEVAKRIVQLDNRLYFDK